MNSTKDPTTSLEPICETVSLTARLWKRSPAAPCFQPRTFRLHDGRITYTSDTGEQRSLLITATTRATIISQERFEFGLSGVTQVYADGAETSARKYIFRAEEAAVFHQWLSALDVHVANEYARGKFPTRHMEAQSEWQAAQAASPQTPPGNDRKKTRTQANAEALPRELLKRSKAFPHPWQKREVRLVGGALLYTAGTGSQKGISTAEIKSIRMVDHKLNEFEISTSCKSYAFRAPDKSSAFAWVKHLQHLIEEQRVARDESAENRPPRGQLQLDPLSV